MHEERTKLVILSSILILTFVVPATAKPTHPLHHRDHAQATNIRSKAPAEKAVHARKHHRWVRSESNRRRRHRFVSSSRSAHTQYASLQSGAMLDSGSPWYSANPAFEPAVNRRMSRRADRLSSRRATKFSTLGSGGFTGFGGGSSIVADARRYIGTNPTGRSSLWCARFMNMVLERNGRRGTGSDMASSFASYGRRIAGPQVGAIAVMSRGRRGGHVGVVSGIDQSGNPVVISGNHGGRVAEATYPRGRIYAYVMPE